MTAYQETAINSFQEYDFKVSIASCLFFGFHKNFHSNTTIVSQEITIASSLFFATSSHLFNASVFTSSL